MQLGIIVFMSVKSHVLRQYKNSGEIISVFFFLVWWTWFYTVEKYELF